MTTHTHEKLSTSAVPPSLARASGVVLVVGALVALAALIYALITLPADSPGTILLCIACAALLAAVIGALLKGGSWQAATGLTVLAGAAALLAGNLMLMIVTPELPIDSAEAAIRTGVPFDTRTRWELVGDLRREGTQAYPRSPTDELLRQFPDEFAELVPLGGVSRATTVLCNESGAYAIYPSDRYGFNNDDSVHDASGGLDMLVVGDSFAQGNCVPPGQDVAGQLRRLGWNAATVGTGGNGPLLELASLVEYGRAWQPPVVVWLYYTGNDLTDLIEERRNPTLLRYLDGYRQNLVERQGEVDSLLKRVLDNEFVEQAEAAGRERVQSARKETTSLTTHLKQMVTLYEMRRRVGMDRESLGDGRENVLPLLERIMHTANGIVRSWGGELRVAYLPDWRTFAQQASATREEVLAVFRRAGLPVVDFEAALRDTGDPLRYFPFRLPNHYTPEGYSLLAEQILKVQD